MNNLFLRAELWLRDRSSGQFKETLNKHLLVEEGVHNTGFQADRSVHPTFSAIYWTFNHEPAAGV